MNDYVTEAIIEIPLGSKNKYERDEKTGHIKLDRVLYSAMNYPTEYGIIDQTLAGDGDPLDVLVICDYPTFAGCVVPARILGYLTMYDKGEDYKLISVLDCDPRYSDIHSLEDLPKFKLEEIRNFFENYKELQHVKVSVGEYHGRDEAIAVIEQCKEAYKQFQR